MCYLDRAITADPRTPISCAGESGSVYGGALLFRCRAHEEEAVIDLRYWHRSICARVFSTACIPLDGKSTLPGQKIDLMLPSRQIAALYPLSTLLLH